MVSFMDISLIKRVEINLLEICDELFSLKGIALNCHVFLLNLNAEHFLILG